MDLKSLIANTGIKPAAPTWPAAHQAPPAPHLPTHDLPSHPRRLGGDENHLPLQGPRGKSHLHLPEEGHRVTPHKDFDQQLKDITMRADKEGQSDAMKGADLAGKADNALGMLQTSVEPEIKTRAVELRSQLRAAVDQMEAAMKSGDQGAIKAASAEIARIYEETKRMAKQEKVYIE
ncbi:MAG TPA: hypothetical protein V6D05_06565 [Stenomitos sp.]